MEQAAGGPPRFFTLASVGDGTVLAGTCGRGSSRSTDGGRTWTALAGEPGSGWTNTFAAGPDGSVYAATERSGVHRSVDGGVTWTATAIDRGTAYAVAAVGDVVVAGLAEAGVVRSTDGGATWRPVDGSPTTAVHRVVPRASGGALVGTVGAGVWVLDAGAERAQPAGLDGRTIYSVAELPGGRWLAGTKEAGLHASDDGGRTWVPSGDGLPDPVVHCLLVTGDRVVAGTGRGVVASDDGGRTWTLVGDLAERRIFSLAATPAGVLAGSYDGVWLGPEPWTPIDTGLTDDAFAIGWVGDVLLAGTASGQVRRSADGGATWEVVTEVGSTVYGFGSCGGRAVAGTDDGVVDVATGARLGLAGERAYCFLEPEPGVVLVGTLGAGLHRTDDGGTTWQRIADVDHAMALGLLALPDGTVLLATGAVVDGTKTGGVRRSEDGGRTWAPATAPSTTVYRLGRLPDGTVLAAAQRSDILRSVDGGRTWTSVATTGLDGAKTYAFTVDAAGRAFLGAGAGTFRSDDGGTSWTRLDTPVLDGVTVFSIVAGNDGGLVMATSAGFVMVDPEPAC